MTKEQADEVLVLLRNINRQLGILVKDNMSSVNKLFKGV